MPPSHSHCLFRRHQSVTTVLSNRLQQSVPRFPTPSFWQHQRLVHERHHQIQDVRGLHASAHTDCLGGFQVPSSGKHRQPPKQHLLCFREQVVTPVDRRPKCLLPREDYPAASGEEPKPVIQARSDLFHCQDLYPRCGQFNGKRDAVQLVADLRHGGRVLTGDRKAWSGRACPIDE